MRLLPILSILLPALLMAQDKATPAAKAIEWVSLEKAQELTKKTPRPIIVDVYTEWCGPCKMLAARTFTDPRVVEFVNQRFYAVKFNAESGDPVTFKGKEYTNPDFNPAATSGRNGTHQLTMAIAPVNGRIAYPTVVYLNSDLELLTPVQGYFTPEQIEPIFRFFGEGIYKDTPYEDFMQGFSPTWKNAP